MSRLIAAVDNSPAGRPVLAMARAVAPFFGAVVEAVHVLEDGDETACAEADHAGVTLQRLEGDVAARLAEAIADDGVVAAVIGARGHAVQRRLGHLPLQVASSTDKPVIVVPPSAEPPDRLRRVLVAIEGTAAKAKQLKRAVALIESTGLELDVVHVDDESSIPAFSEQVQHETEAYADEFFARFLPGLTHARLDLRIGTAVDQILAVCRERDAELLAVGWPPDVDGRGETARELLDRCPVPVLLVAIA